PGICGIDTRALTKIIRESGCMLGKIVFEDEMLDWYDPNADNLVAMVSTPGKKVFGSGKHKIMLVDCGVKFNIIRSLLDYDTTVIRVPYDYDFLSEEYDGLFITNGPGDPAMCTKTIQHLSKAIEADIPIFGICLGSQLLGIASGATTYKLKYGHRSHNQPVIQHGTNQCFITSQNHGFAVDHTNLKNDWEVYFTNLNDNTCEGIRHREKPIFSTQFHPEASGGPTDTAFLFSQFIEMIEKQR
ncbi:MAG: carbamoyl phosphate synthase small subunit, partial [Bacteroidales bacterium]|nr:carbamoyl phosphate synthase small subunit [Bacteroidales bacterium]